MNFLYPLFLVGALAVALPILFHLIRRSPRNRIPFSALRFLEPSSPRLTRKSRLEHLWLLLLRCLILLLLAAAFARPYLESALGTFSDKTNPPRHFFLLDASASMKRGRAWEDARAILRRQLEQIETNARAAVCTFDTQLRPLITFEQWDAANPPNGRAARLLNQANQASPSWKATHLGNALLAAIDLLQESTSPGEENQDWRIHIIGDLQSGMLRDGLQGFEWPKHCAVELHPVAVEGNTNVGLHLMPSANGWEEHETARIRISNTASSTAETFQLGWAKQGREKAAVSPIEVYLPAGKNLVMNAPPEPIDFPPDVLRILGDDHDFDNAVWQVPFRARKSKVLYLGEPAGGNPDTLLFYLEKAFQQTRRHVVSVEVFPPDRLLPQESVKNLQLIVIGEPLAPALVEQVNRLNAGGATTLIVLHQASLEPTLQAILQDPAIAVTASPSQNYSLFGQIDFQHPLFSSFADPRFSDFTKIRFWSRNHLHLENSKIAKTIARFDDGLPAIVQFSRGSSSLFATAFGWQPKHSGFALSTKFVPFLYAMLDFGAETSQVQSHYFVGQEVNLSSLADTGAISIQTPSGDLIPLNDDSRFRETSEPGIYTIQTAESSIRFAVNLHPSESDTTPILEETLLGLGIPFHQTISSETTNPLVEETKRKLKAAEIENSQKFWRWIVGAALLVAILETLCSALFSRPPEADSFATEIK